MVFYIFQKDRKGITLIEILLTLALFGVIINLAFFVFGFGTNLFVQGESRATIQQNMRNALNYIIREVRLAEEVEILEISSVPETVGNDNEIYILINEDGILEFRKHSNNNGSFTFSDTLLHNTSLTLQFKREGDQLLGITVGNTSDSTTVESEVTILNLIPDGKKIDESKEEGEALKIEIK